MSADVNEVARLLDALGIEHSESADGHDIRWRDHNGCVWAYYGAIYGSCDSRLCAYGVTPDEAVRRSIG